MLAGGSFRTLPTRNSAPPCQERGKRCRGLLEATSTSSVVFSAAGPGSGVAHCTFAGAELGRVLSPEEGCGTVLWEDALSDCLFQVERRGRLCAPP